MLKKIFAGCLGLSSVVSTQFTLEMCVAASNREKKSQKTYFGVQGRLSHQCWYPLKARQHCLL